MKTPISTLLLALLVACGGSEAPAEAPPPADEAPAPAEQAAPEAAEAASEHPEPGVFFVSPADGAVVSSPVKIQMGVRAMTVEQAGAVNPGAGHHHIIVNGSAIEAGKQVPKDEQHIHFGGGQTETELELEPGQYTLTLQFADGAHVSYGEKLASTVHVTVQ